MRVQKYASFLHFLIGKASFFERIYKSLAMRFLEWKVFFGKRCPGHSISPMDIQKPQPRWKQKSFLAATAQRRPAKRLQHTAGKSSPKINRNEWITLFCAAQPFPASIRKVCRNRQD